MADAAQRSGQHLQPLFLPGREIIHVAHLQPAAGQRGAGGNQRPLVAAVAIDDQQPLEPGAVQAFGDIGDDADESLQRQRDRSGPGAMMRREAERRRWQHEHMRRGAAFGRQQRDVVCRQRIGIHRQVIRMLLDRSDRQHRQRTGVARGSDLGARQCAPVMHAVPTLIHGTIPSGSSSSTDSSRSAAVCGCWMRPARRSSVLSVSTSSPPCITPTRSHRCATTARLWLTMM